MTSCNHLDSVDDVVVPTTNGCADCLASGDTWVHLRMCRSCGRVGCCDDSANRHASGHARQHGHLIASSFEPGEDWWWCYDDELMFFMPSLPGFSHSP